MWEQFGNYSEMYWVATAAAQGIGPGDKIQIHPDLINFRLEDFKDLRKQLKIDEKQRFKLMLIDMTHKTNIFIDGPDKLLEEMLIRLPSYKGKSWAEIKNMCLERSFTDCINAYSSVCDPSISENMEFKPIKPGQEAHELDFTKADEACAKCKHFGLK